MAAHVELLEKLEPREHGVQLYGEDEQVLIRNVGRYLAEGRNRGESLLVIATPRHRQALARQLRKEGHDAIEAAQEGRLVFLDAQTVLDRLMVDGQPDRERFDSIIGGAVREAKARGGQAGLRAFGELVGLLWSAGQVSAAIRLEGYWNELLKSEEFSLFCAYPIDVFGPEFQEGTIDGLLCAHTHLVPGDRDLERAVDRALSDVLGAKAGEVMPPTEAGDGPSWAVMPRAERIILWLRKNLQDYADEIVDRARRYSQALRSKRSSAKLGLMKTGDAAKLLGTTTRTLLFYEEEGLVRPRRTEGGTRMYSQFDLSRAEIAIRLSRLGFPLKLIKRLALARSAAGTGREASQQLAVILEEMVREIETRLTALSGLAEDIARADTLIRQCADCPNRPTRRSCPQCPCELNVDRSALLHLTGDPER